MNPTIITSVWLFLAYFVCSFHALHKAQVIIQSKNTSARFNNYKRHVKFGNGSQKNPVEFSRHFGIMIRDTSAADLIKAGATIGGALGPVGSVIGGIIGAVLCIFICKDGSPPPNEPPKFTFCPPNDKILYAEEGKTSAKFEWTEPKAVDPEEGDISVKLDSGRASGSHFPRGEHTVIYKAFDKKGLMATCVFRFTVEVSSCEPPQWPINGYIRCDKSELIAGTSCKVGCSPGFELTPKIQTIKCVKKGNKASMDETTPLCQEIICPVDVPEMKPKHGIPICTHQNYKYDSACSTQCDIGYSPSSMMFSVCQRTGRWSRKLPDCKDSDPPTIKHCPNTIREYTDRRSRTAVVSWKPPTPVDNSNSVTLTQTRGRKIGEAFDVGFEEIRYQATDSAGNKSPECIFFVVVEELRCNPPIITDKYMTYQCPDGFTYGSECNLRCMGRFPLIGNDTIVCERKRNSTNYPSPTYWDKGDIEPFCKLNPCKDLPAPVNGAMSCDTWMFGTQCQMQCSDKFDIPAIGSSFNGVFTCSEKEGIFKPLNTVPNCTVKRLPGHVETLGEFFYYTGSCNDTTVMEKIKTNFINQMKVMEENGFAGVCSDLLDCNIKNVSVTCGPRSRKRRSADDTLRSKRSESEIRVEIQISSNWPLSNASTVNSLEIAKEIQQKIFEKIKDISKAGKLTVDGISPDDESFVLGYSASVCDKALFLRQDTLTCVPCTRGSFLTTNNRGRQVCTPCPKGFYKVDEYEPTCTPCPLNTSTVQTGSMQFTDCIEKCNPGEFSDTGLSPCTPCKKSTYQSNFMSRHCMQCPADKTTTFTGSTHAVNCTNIVISGYQIALKALSVDQILQSAKTCHSTFSDSYITMADLRNVYLEEGVEAIAPTQCDSVNECDTDPCNGHQCVNKLGGFVCQCDNGYHGNTCEIKPDFCQHDPCQNGATCVNTNNGNYTCSCSKGYKGIRCEKMIVNGGWSAWGQFSECSVSCNGGTKLRTRICNSPAPDPEGTPCNVSDAEDHVTCNMEKCPVCPPLKRSFGSVRQCKLARDGHKLCNVTCRPGYAFMPGNLPLTEYVCGRNTSYIWNGEPPACGKMEIPKQISTETVVSYRTSITCDKASVASKTLKAKMESTLQCARNKTCKVTVEAKECLQSNRKKRAVRVQSQHITLTTTHSENIDLQSIAKTQQSTDAANKYIIGLSDLELSAQQLHSSNDQLRIIIDGEILAPTEQTTSSVVNCPEGQGRFMFLCADCPSGTYSALGSCIQCSQSTYQDETGQTACKLCPKGRTTKYEGSQSQLECIETSVNKVRPKKEAADESITHIIAITVSGIAVLGFVIFVWIFAYRKCIRPRLSNDAWRSRNQGTFHMIATNE